MPDIQPALRKRWPLLLVLGVVALLAYAASGPRVLPSPARAGTALSAGEEAAIGQGVVQLLASKVNGYRNIGYPDSCTKFFDLGAPRVIDTTLTGNTGKVRVEVPITAARAQIGHVGHRSFPGFCYGEPAGGWREGETVSARFNVNVEKWASGWQLAQRQELVATP